jgi:hypothetical protein
LIVGVAVLTLIWVQTNGNNVDGAYFIAVATGNVQRIGYALSLAGLLVESIY